ncbi:radical SAM protein [Candidatus Woesearchaeota archaeon]|nr:radical SAM protein [Candidatus Woesearchaeota archaeon]
MKKIIKTPYYSFRIGALPKGCKQCVKGLKSVFFITGICSNDCFFCPISDQKKNKDVIYINEWPTKKTNEILKEIKLCSSSGVGITGGDPLLRLNRTLKYTRLLKKTFGDSFHVHIYLPLEHVDEDNLEKLFKAGLDEIRFHPDIDNESYWHRILLAKEFSWQKGIEIPVIPKKLNQTKKLIDFIHDKVDFLNLNELEFSDTNFNRVLEQGYRAKNEISYAVKGSDKTAKDLMKYILKKGYNLNVHYCTAKLKDRIQLSSRIKKRAENTAKEYDIIDDEGILVRGAIYPTDIIPGFEYRKKLSEINKLEKMFIIQELNKIMKKLKNKFEIPDEMIEVDKAKLRILTNANILLEIYKELDYKCAIVKEFPTYDLFEVEIEFLG